MEDLPAGLGSWTRTPGKAVRFRSIFKTTVSVLDKRGFCAILRRAGGADGIFTLSDALRLEIRGKYLLGERACWRSSFPSRAVQGVWSLSEEAFAWVLSALAAQGPARRSSSSAAIGTIGSVSFAPFTKPSFIQVAWC